MIDFLTKTKLSGGSLTKENLQRYATEHGVNFIGIVETNFFNKKHFNVGTSYIDGVELLTSDQNLSLVFYANNNETNAELVYNEIAHKYHNFYLEVWQDLTKQYGNLSSYDTKFKNNIGFVSLIHILNSSGITNSYKSALALLYSLKTSNTLPTIVELTEVLQKHQVYFYICVKDNKLPQITSSFLKGFIIHKNNSELLQFCMESNTHCLPASFFDNHFTGEELGVNVVNENLILENVWNLI